MLLILSSWICIDGASAQVKAEGANVYTAANDRMGQIEVVLLSKFAGADIAIKGSPGNSISYYQHDKDHSFPLNIPLGTDGYFHLSDPKDGGYIVKRGNDIDAAYWLVDYSGYTVPQSISASDYEDNLCTQVLISWSENLKPITYRTPAGLEKTIKRKLAFSYPSLIWDEDLKRFTPTIIKEDKETASNSVVLTQSLQDVVYTLEGDRFGKELGIDYPHAVSNEFQSKRMEIHAYMLVHKPDENKPRIKSLNSLRNGKEAGDDNSDKGNSSSEQIDFSNVSAPLDIDFIAIGNDPVPALYTWTIYPTSKPEEITLKFSGPEFSHTFRDAGSYTITLEVSNRNGLCSDFPFEDRIVIKESFLDVPNAFSPNASPGINDIFKVKYKSLVNFEAYIFDRYGNQLYSWKDPSQGWDGKYKGKFVAPGVYFYVIKAKGADGIDYVKKGDVNIIGFDGDEGTDSNQPVAP